MMKFDSAPVVAAGFVVAWATICQPAPAMADDKQLCEHGFGNEAIAACTRRIQHHRNSSASNAAYNLAVVYYSRGWLYESQKDLNRALADYELSYRSDSSFVRALYARGLIKKKKGNSAGGQADMDRALKIDPTLLEKK